MKKRVYIMDVRIQKEKSRLRILVLCRRWKYVRSYKWGRGPRYGLIVVVTNHCDGVDALIHDLPRGVIGAMWASLYNLLLGKGKLRSPIIQGWLKETLDRGLAAWLQLGSTSMVESALALSLSRSGLSICLVMCGVLFGTTIPYRPRRCKLTT